jgi:hypothetical protein
MVKKSNRKNQIQNQITNYRIFLHPTSQYFSSKENKGTKKIYRSVTVIVISCHVSSFGHLTKAEL